MKGTCTRCGRKVGHLNTHEGEFWVMYLCDRCEKEVEIRAASQVQRAPKAP